MTLQTNNEADKKVRKSLSEQIDRLDSLLDGLADNLNAAVADAVRDAVGGAVREAVQATLLELLAHPEIKSLLQAATASAMQLLADVASDGFVPSLGDLLWPVLGWACISVLVAVAVTGLLVVHLMNLVARLFYKPMGNEPAPGRSADSSRPEAR